ncbi:arsenate reductase ArsC [Microbulbifer rhizosphaerae]|uniref:Arsenate reductase n=1 Tax=Microbulbifer rhizosphaerae TaxID=1562603 RepID=A0A7W4W902_9GAMM|nr:arsenate reductase ArsC [Microbulbifer rhizosphaerae]MBB3059915.1 arsenate reductase [Microbulbifer rhizosphaerae]
MHDSVQKKPRDRWTLLVLCTGNSARSIMAEAIFNSVGSRHFNAYSAGSRPTGQVNPHALNQITSRGIPLLNYRSKNWLEFSRAGAPELDLLLTVCDGAAAEPCPAFYGDYEHIHWGLPDPAAAADGQKRAAFSDCFDILKSRVQTLAALPLAGYSRAEVARAMRAFAGQTETMQ